MIYYRNQNKLKNVFGCFKSGVPDRIEENTILNAFLSGDLDIENCALSEKEYIESVLSRCATENGISITNQGLSCLAESLMNHGVRSINGVGTIALEGAISVVPPSMVKEIKRIIG